MKRLSRFSRAALLVLASYLVLEFAVTPPLPSSLVYLYMGLILIGILAQIAVEEEGPAQFLRPVRQLLAAEDRRRSRVLWLSAVPLAVGLAVFGKLRVSADPPAELRTVHPAPPPAIDFRGQAMPIVGLQNPYRHGPDYDRHVEEGRAIYSRNCHFCHGDDLDGSGMFAAAFNPRPANFRDPGTIAMLQESFVFWRVAKGGPGLPKSAAPWSSAMPAWEGMLTEDEIWKVILFIYDATGQTPRTWE